MSQETVFFTAPRFLNLRRASIRRNVLSHGDGVIKIEFLSPVLQHRVEFDLAGAEYRASDNFFDLYPNVPHHVLIRAEHLTEAELSERLSTRSLVDSY